MARVFLLNPPSPEPVKTPLLSFCHLAASLRAAGHEVALLDASAIHAPRTPDEIAARIRAFAPALIGLHLKTLQVQQAYALTEVLGEIAPLVAGGPHATVCPDEPFRHGFRFVLRGEAELSLPALADVFEGRRALGEIEGLSYLGPLGPRHNPSADFLRNLDELPSPVEALDLFDPAWYGAARPIPPAGLLSSRGCPAACTFCANNVTGRRFRYRSAASVIGEIQRLQARYDLRAFSFFDDSFAVGHRRVRELCAALRRLRPRVYWTCTAHPAHLDPESLREMKSAGCGGVDIGMESADPEMLLRIGKGVTVERVLDVLGWCRDLGLHTVVNLMFGWPGDDDDETDAELDATRAFMTRAAPLAGGFNARGVLVPHPGTEIYDRHHERFGFTEWWIREEPIVYPPFPTEWSAAEVARCYAEDPALDRNFFRHPPHRIQRIREALRAKASFTLRQLDGSYATRVPAAGAR